MTITFAVEWNAGDVVEGTFCRFTKLAENATAASAFMTAMNDLGHQLKFSWGDGNAWASDFEHPEFTNQTGDSLNWVDDVNMVYFAGHGANENGISFASNHFSCRAFYENMRLGVKNLRWLILEVCDAVIDAGDSVMRVWSTPTDGDSMNPRKSLHVVCTFIGEEAPGIYTQSGAVFAILVSLPEIISYPVANAWLDASFRRSGSSTNKPIAIAFGRDEAEAIAVRDNGTLDARDQGPVIANWLAWKWRE